MNQVLETALHYLQTLPGEVVYIVIFSILIICGLGLPIPEDITLFAAAMSAYYGMTNVWAMMILCYLGIILGDSVIFFLGAKHGRRLLNVWPFRAFLSEAKLQSLQELLHSKGDKLIFMARFMPGLRAPIYFACGALHIPYMTFLAYDGLAALLSVPAIIGLVYYFGDQVDSIVKAIQRFEHGLLAVIIVVIVVFFIKQRRGRSSSVKN